MDQLNDTLAQMRRDHEEQQRQKDLQELERRNAEQQAAAAAQHQAFQDRMEQLRQQGERLAQQQEDQKRGFEALNIAVSRAVLEHRCDDAKTIALTAGNLDLADRAVRLCTPLKAVPKARSTNLNKRRGVPVAKSSIEQNIDCLYIASSGINADYRGENLVAQNYYRKSLKCQRNPKVSRYLAMSLAISGDERGAEIIFKSLIDSGDVKSQRARVIALAILGKTEMSVSLAHLYSPKELADKITPYLSYAKLLSNSQKAKFSQGYFPPLKEIGKDGGNFFDFDEDFRSIYQEWMG